MLYYYRWQNCFYVFKVKSSSTKIVIHASLCVGPFFYFMLSQFTYSFYLRSKHLCELCALILTCLPIALVILLCVDNYPWDIHVTSWKQLLKLNHPLCCFNTFYFESIALWVNSYARLIDACWWPTSIGDRNSLRGK